MPSLTPPEKGFDPDWYIARYADVAADGVDPVKHFAECGRAEGRFPNAEAEHYHTVEVPRELMALVDPAWYVANYMDVAAAGADPFEHYARAGHAEGRFPNSEAAARHLLRREVDPEWYTARYPDVTATGLDPAEHYALRGYAEGRLPNPTRLPAVCWSPGAGTSPLPQNLRHYPLIGVVTPVRNRRAWTVGFARMLDVQDYPLFRFYAVDSGSTDGTPQALKSLGIAGLVVLEAPDAAYWTAATNIGVAQALADGCEYVVTVNDDAIVPSDFLTSIVAAAQRADARIVGSVIAFADTPGRLWGVGAYNDWNAGSFVQLSMAGEWDDSLAKAPLSPDGLLAADYLCGNGTLIHSSVFAEIGLYDVRHLPHYHADSEFTMRAERAGIARWVAPGARLYNRFTEAADGSFAARNQRFFSLRSANYARPLVFIIDKYCPRDLKAQALVRYFVRHIREPDDRTWSRLLRIVHFIDTPEDKRRVTRARFFPPLDPVLRAAEDLPVLLDLSDSAFRAMLYPVLLRRLESETERERLAEAIGPGSDRRNIVREILARPEARYARHAHATFLSTLLAEDSILSDALASAERRQPPPSVDAGRLPSRAQGRTTTESADSVGPRVGEDEPLTVYMNVDVLCMAVTDPRAATGVHRYVLNIMRELAHDVRVDLQLFFAPQLADSAAELRKGILADAVFARSSLHAQTGVAFYPYFPFAGKDGRFNALPQIFTLCDLFPLTNPNWFSAAAVTGFRGQLRSLANADHVLCISAATQNALHDTFPTLRATSSVAHLGVHPRSKRAEISASETCAEPDGTPYFICVGTIEPRKNLRTVIAAMRHLTASAVRDLRMVVVGQAGWSITAEELTVLAGADAARIAFLGRVPDEQLWGLYAGAICTVFPSMAEGFGFPIVESFSCGTPVVTSNGSSMAEIAGAGALFVDPTDPTAIATAVERLATDPALRDALAREADARGRLFSWQACATRHVEAFEKVAALRSTPGQIPGEANRPQAGETGAAASTEVGKGSVQ